MQFSTLVTLDILISALCMGYYYYWGVYGTEKRIAKAAELLEHIKIAYVFSAATIFIIPTLLLYFLYSNILVRFPVLFFQTALIILILIVVFEYVNYWSFMYYERKRIR